MSKRLIFEGERTLLGEIDPHDEHTVGMLERNACRSRLGRVGPEQIAVTQRGEHPLELGRQLSPLHCITDGHQIYFVSERFGALPVVGKCDDEDATGSPQSPQFLRRHPERVIDGIGLSQLPIESVFAACRER